MKGMGWACGGGGGTGGGWEALSVVSVPRQQHGHAARGGGQVPSAVHCVGGGDGGERLTWNCLASLGRNRTSAVTLYFGSRRAASRARFKGFQLDLSPFLSPTH